MFNCLSKFSPMGAIGDSPHLPPFVRQFCICGSGVQEGNGKSIDRTFNLGIKNPHLPLG